MLDKLKQKAVTTNPNRESMTHVYVNDPKLEKGLGGLFTRTSITGYMPAYRSNWNNVPGFTEDGKPKPGTEFSGDAQFVTQGGNIIFRPTYSYIDPETKSPITLMELGIHAHGSKIIIMCCPDGFYRKGNVEIVCDRYAIMCFNELDGAKKVLDMMLNGEKLNTPEFGEW